MGHSKLRHTIRLQTLFKILLHLTFHTIIFPQKDIIILGSVIPHCILVCFFIIIIWNRERNKIQHDAVRGYTTKPRNHARFKQATILEVLSPTLTIVTHELAANRDHV